jgi:hypothetical protein
MFRGWFEDESHLLDNVEASDALAGNWRYTGGIRHSLPCGAIRFMMTGKNRLHSSQTHLSELKLSGDVIRPDELLPRHMNVCGGCRKTGMLRVLPSADATVIQQASPVVSASVLPAEAETPFVADVASPAGKDLHVIIEPLVESSLDPPSTASVPQTAPEQPAITP